MTPYLQQKTLFPPLIQTKPSLNLGIIVVIPAYDEAFLLLSLMTLQRCDMPRCDIEVIVVINDSENDSEELRDKHIALRAQVIEWAQKHRRNQIKFHVIYQDRLPQKHAGVGLARKIGMDEACWRFEKLRSSKGIIACFDADSRCDKDYFLAIDSHFTQYPKCQAASIYFEHPLHGPDFEEPVYEAIVDYELHLRYYINAQRYSGFPFAFQTIGSSMAVRCAAYQKQGGMNRRKAGEDFYFIHKFTPLGHFGEICSTRVIPSPRPSHRVPFGTGRAVSQLLDSKKAYETYAPASFQDLKQLFAKIPTFYDLDEQRLTAMLAELPTSISAFLAEAGFIAKVMEIRSHTANVDTFKNRFFRWFNAFQLMKYLHFSRDHFYPNVNVNEAAHWLLQESKLSDFNEELSNKDLLLKFRMIDRYRNEK